MTSKIQTRFKKKFVYFLKTPLQIFAMKLAKLPNSKNIPFV